MIDMSKNYFVHAGRVHCVYEKVHNQDVVDGAIQHQLTNTSCLAARYFNRSG